MKRTRDNIYDLLGIHAHAPAKVVKKRFREFARQNHPDLYPGDRVREEQFKMVCSAYQTWKLIHATVEHIRRIRTASPYAASDNFSPWTFNCTA